MHLYALTFRPPLLICSPLGLDDDDTEEEGDVEVDNDNDDDDDDTDDAYDACYVLCSNLLYQKTTCNHDDSKWSLLLLEAENIY